MGITGKDIIKNIVDAGQGSSILLDSNFSIKLPKFRNCSEVVNFITMHNLENVEFNSYSLNVPDECVNGEVEIIVESANVISTETLKWYKRSFADYFSVKSMSIRQKRLKTYKIIFYIPVSEKVYNDKKDLLDEYYSYHSHLTRYTIKHSFKLFPKEEVKQVAPIIIRDKSQLKIVRVNDYCIFFNYEGKSYFLHTVGSCNDDDTIELYERELSNDKVRLTFLGHFVANFCSIKSVFIRSLSSTLVYNQIDKDFFITALVMHGFAQTDYKNLEEWG